MSARSPQQLIALFDKKIVVVLEEMQKALHAASRATVFRCLAQVGYRRGYNRNGRYYTRDDPSRYDKHGVFSCKEIHFFRHGNLSATVSLFIPRGDQRYKQACLPALEAERLSEIEKATESYLEDLRRRVGNESLVKPHTPHAIILKYCKNHREHLFGHPVIRDDDGTIIAVVERTNNAAEHFTI